MIRKSLSLLSFLKAAVVASVVSVIVNVLIYFAGKGTSVFTDAIEIQPGQPLSVMPVIVSSILPTVIGALLCFVLIRFLKAGKRIFLMIAFGFLAITFANPFMLIKDVTTAYAMGLNAMHVVVFVALFWQLRKVW